MGHADGFGTLGLARINGNNAAPDGFRHVSAGIDGNDDNAGQPHTAVTGEDNLAIREIGKAVVNEYCLQNHWRTSEDFYIDPDKNPDQLQHQALERGIIFGIGDGVENATDQADHTADSRGGDGKEQGVLHTVEIGGGIGIPQAGNVIAQF